jgi:hypothetical protein
VTSSPVEQIVAAVDRLDIEAAMGLFAPDPELLVADGRRARGHDAVHALLAEFFSALRMTVHRITAEWQLDGVVIAELDADYELRDSLLLQHLPRALIVRASDEGITSLHAYGAHERPLVPEHRAGDEGFMVGGRWVPPL